MSQRFGSNFNSETNGGKCFEELYKVILPEIDPRESHVGPFDLRCDSCVHEQRCVNDIRKNVNRYIDRVLFVKESQEVKGLSSLIEKIEREYDDADTATIKEAVISDIRSAQHRLRVAYPNIKKWSKIVAEVSTAALTAETAMPRGNIAIPATLAAATGGYIATGVINEKASSEAWKITFADNYGC